MRICVKPVTEILGLFVFSLNFTADRERGVASTHVSLYQPVVWKMAGNRN
jgi:hypothetical protein